MAAELKKEVPIEIAHGLLIDIISYSRNSWDLIMPKLELPIDDAINHNSDLAVSAT